MTHKVHKKNALKVLFILFPGHLGSNFYWKYVLDSKGKSKENCFYKRLRRIGEIYEYVPKVNNICYYEKTYTKKDKGFKPIDSLSLNDLSIDYQCKQVYAKVKDFNGKFVPIGHSIGSWFCIHFAKLYGDRCKMTILLDPSFITPKVYRKTHKKAVDLRRYGKIFTQKRLDELINTIKTIKNKKTRIKLIEQDYFNSIIKHYMKTTDKFTSKLNVPNLSFLNISVQMKPTDTIDSNVLLNRYTVMEQDELRKINGNNSKTVYLINASHKPWLIPKYCEEIIETLLLHFT